MVRKSVLSLMMLIGLLIWHAPVLSQQPKGEPKTPDEKKAEENKKWVGFWQTKHGPYKEYWMFKEKEGKLVVEGAFVDSKNNFAGKFLGDMPKLENGVYTFTREWFEKPKSDNEDSVKITASLQADGESLVYSAKSFGVAKTFVMSKMAKAPVIGPQATDVVGIWKTSHSGMEEVVVIKPAGNVFQVQTTWLQGFVTRGVMVPTAGQWNPSTGELKWQQVYAVSPNKSWHNGSLMTAKLLQNGHLRIHWQQLPGGGTGYRDFSLVPGTGIVKAPIISDDPPPKTVDPVPMPGFDAQAIIGSFSGDIEGFKEIWTITRDDAGMWAVKGAYLKGDDEVGGFTGRNVMIKDGKLTFTQEFTKLPAGASWINGSTITVSPGANNTLSYFWQAGAATGTRVLTKGR